MKGGAWRIRLVTIPMISARQSSAISWASSRRAPRRSTRTRRPASTTVILGSGYDGPVGFDLVRDGPHALIAGTTGSGKSELLQSLVASASLVNRPDELVFVLVDYKGGSAFRDCVRLPHVLGMVTDLDSHLVERALASLGAELRRREQLLADSHKGEDAQPSDRVAWWQSLRATSTRRALLLTALGGLLIAGLIVF